MSGVYFIVWDDHKDHFRLLKPTDGGWPHITLFYSGTNIDLHTLQSMARLIADASSRPVTIADVRINSFMHEREGKMRYDVLLDLDKATIEYIDRTRMMCALVNSFDTAQFEQKVSMMKPHITVGCYWTQEEAAAHYEQVAKLLEEEKREGRSVHVKVTGVAID